MSEGFSPLWEAAGFVVGGRVAGYRLEEQIGRGGMAVVFRAHDERLDRQVALKILAPALSADVGFRQRFIRESRAAAAVDDPHIIPVFQAGDSDGVLFIAMRLVRGGDLRSLVGHQGPLAPARAEWIVSAVASALDAAHSAGLVHRDVKPANMLLEVRPGRPDHVYLSDFGLSKGSIASSGLTGTGQFLGTVDYAAPEQIQGLAVDGRTDQYALGCSAFEMLCGQSPFRRDQGLAAIYAHLYETPPALTSRQAGLPAAVDAVFAKVLAKSPADRFDTCQQFADALGEALGVQPYVNYGIAGPGQPDTEVALADLAGHHTGDLPVPAEPAPARDESTLAEGSGAERPAAELAAAEAAAADAAVAEVAMAEAAVTDAAVAEAAAGQSTVAEPALARRNGAVATIAEDAAAHAVAADGAVPESTVAGGSVPDGAGVVTMKRPVRISPPASDAAGSAGPAEAATAPGLPPDDQPPASAGGVGHGRSGLRRAAAAAAVVVVAAGAVGISLALGGGKPSGPAAPKMASYTFPLHTFKSGLQIAQTWTLSGHRGSVFTAAITASSATGKAITVSYTELIPTEITPNISAVTFTPAPTTTLSASHLVIWRLNVPAHGSVVVGYHVGVPADGATAARLSNCRRAYATLAAQLAARNTSLVIKSLTIKPGRVQIAVGRKVSLKLSGVLSSGKGATSAELASAVWKSGNSAVATVNAGGQVTARGQGTTRITVQLGHASASTVIVVTVAQPGSNSGTSYYSPPSNTGSPTPHPSGTTTLTPTPLAVPPGSGQAANAGMEAGGGSLQALMHLG